MKKKLLAALALTAVVLTGCGTSQNAELSQTEIEEEKFTLPVECKLSRVSISLNYIYILQEKTESGYDGLMVIEFDLSDMSEQNMDWVEQEYRFNLSDSSDLSDGSFIHLGDDYETRIQDDGKKYVFAEIGECKEPLNTMEISLDMDIQCIGGDSSFNDIYGKGANFDIVEELPENVELAINDIVEELGLELEFQPYLEPDSQTDVELWEPAIEYESKQETGEETYTGATVGELNALESASTYLDIMSFSYSGLIEQLEEGDGYTHEEAVYAADNCGADWNEQAAKSAKEYLDIMSFSREELIEQLVDGEGFTHEQAVYGVEHNGY